MAGRVRLVDVAVRSFARWAWVLAGFELVVFVVG